MDDFDHRSLGSRLDLFHIQDDAPGMVFWHPRGHAIYRVLEDHIRGRSCGSAAGIGTSSATACSASRARPADRWR